MIGMRYGALPIARRTRRLADTIVDGRNRYLFEREEDFLPSIDCAIAEYSNTSLIKSAMNEDWSWKKSAEKYTNSTR
jgi:glycogen synthase